MVETVLGCNLRCPECAVGGNLTSRKFGRMRLEDYKIIVDKIKPYAETVYLIIWGEPLLNDDIIDMINITSKYAKVIISTNGMLLTEEIANNLIKSGVSSILVSIDGTTQTVYEKYRVGGNLERVLNSLRLLQEINKANGNKVAVIPQFIVFRHNQHQMKDFCKSCSSLGLEASFKSPYLRQNSIFANSDYPEYTRPRFKNEEQRKKAMMGCPDPRSVMTIFIDGSIVPCCHATNSDVNFGNIFEDDVETIWYNSDFIQLRKNIIKGNAPDYCLKNCLSYFRDYTHI
jgi:radical SAM protein with 4Fe4S-binding SPASM domain